MWGNAGLGVSLGIATRPSLPLARRVAPGAVVSAGSCRRLHYVPAVVVATPTLPGRHVVVRVTAASCRRSRCPIDQNSLKSCESLFYGKKEISMKK